MTSAENRASDQAGKSRTDKREPALPFRGDTILGVCEATGQELGFNPNWLRVAFAALLLLSPVLILAVYLGLGVVVAIARWRFGDRDSTAAEQPVELRSKVVEEEERLAA